MRKKQKIKSIINKIKHPHVFIRVVVVALVILLFICLIALFRDRTVQFSFGSDTCILRPTIIPDINKISDKNSIFDIKNKNIFAISNFKILSLKTCFIANKAPSPGKVKLNIAPFGGWFTSKTYQIVTPELTKVKNAELNYPISTIKPLLIKLDNPDRIFTYQLYANGQFLQCLPIKSALSCNVKKLNLINEKQYNIKLVRYFNNQKIATLINETITTIKATRVVNSSIKQNQTVYDNPKNITIEFDKDVKNATITLEKINGQVRNSVANTVSIKGKTAVVTINNDFERSTSYEIKVDKLEAEDSSSLLEEHRIKFVVSGGPSVVSVNVGTYNQPLTKTIVFTLDQTIANTQDVANFVQVSGASASISASNNQIYVNYANLPLCTDLKITINAGFRSNYGITQTKPYSFSTRTTCHAVSSIGYSRQGRSIVSYTFGNGSQSVLYVGSIHGNEYSTKYLMDAWVSELELNARKIPANKRIVVVPLLNPDGLARYSRYNANNVDVNRNFPTNDWQTDVFDPSNRLVVNGGGITPLSEPESQAIAAFSIQLLPRLTVTFHSNAGYAIANQAGDSTALAAVYANLSGYRNMTGNGGAFTYPITGTYDDWLAEKQGLPSVLIELSTSNNSEFYRNKEALWVMARS